MDVASYIREYLFKQDFLDIPGLGTFFLTKEPFSIQDSDQVIKPGSKTLIFRENSGISNDTLSYFIARRASVSIDEAREMVRNFVSPVRQLFLSRGNIEIPGLGQFSVPDGFHLDFRPYPFNFSPSSFGLGNVSLSQFDDQNIHIAEQKTQAESFHTIQAYQAETAAVENLPEVNNDHQVSSPLDESSGHISQPHEHALEDLELPPDSTYNEAANDHNTEDHNSTVNSGHATNADDVNQDDGHLPTAEEIYRIYGFKKEAGTEHVAGSDLTTGSTNNAETNAQPGNVTTDSHWASNTHTANTDSTKTDTDSLLSGSSFSEIPVFNTGSDSSSSYPNTLAFAQEPTDFIKNLEPEAKSDDVTEHAGQEHNSDGKKDLVYNPLAYDSTVLPVTPVSPISQQSEFIPQATGDLGPIQELPSSAYEHQDHYTPERRENAAIYWTLGSILLLCMLATFGYLEREPIMDAINKTGISGQSAPAIKPLAKTDSTGLAATNAATNLNDSINHNKAAGPAETKAIPAISVDSTSTRLAATSVSPDSVLINIENAPRFLLVDASFHLLQTAKKHQKELVAAGTQAHIIQMNKGVLMRYKVSLGEYPDKEAATAAEVSEKAAGHNRLQIFENKSKKN